MQKRDPRNIQGCDVSHWQGDVEWQKVRQAGLAFVYIKATEGTGFVDPKFEANVRGAKEAGLKVGAYHFARFKNKQDAIHEARHFYSIVKSYSLHLPHVLDLETDQGVGAEQLSVHAYLYLETLQALTHSTPMLYTSTAFAKGHLSPALKDYPLWIAHFHRASPEENGIWNEWTVFQYTDNGKVPGIKGKVDLDEWIAADFKRVMKETTDLTPSPNHVIKATKNYEILKGDTFWGLESNHGWTHGILQKLNPGVIPRQLKVGQIIKVPR